MRLTAQTAYCSIFWVLNTARLREWEVLCGLDIHSSSDVRHHDVMFCQAQ